MEPKMIADYECVCGEGPIWHPLEHVLYWLDIPRGRVFRYDPVTGSHEQVYEGDPIGAMTVQEDGALLFLMGKGALKAFTAGRLTTIVPEIPDETGTRFNDAIADPEGRIFGGMTATSERPGRLYRVDTDGNCVRLLGGISGTNGLGFSPDCSRMYYTDSSTRAIYRFDYCRETGEITNQRLFTEIPEELGVPDGMTVDSECFVWSAIWGGSCVIRFAPNGVEDFRVSIPAKRVSSVTFGGADYRDMFITTALADQAKTEEPGAGALYHFRPGVQGRPEFLSRIGL